MRRQFTVLSFANPVLVGLFFSSAIACNMGSKSPYGDLGATGGGGTSTGNAVARNLDLASFEPPLLPSGNVAQMSLTIFKVRARIDGTWHEYALSKSIALQPAGQLLSVLENTGLPFGRYEEVALYLTNFALHGPPPLSLYGTMAQPLVMRFVGSVLEQGAGLALDPQDYVDHVATATNPTQLLSGWNSSTGALVPRGSGPHHHVLFTTPPVTSGNGIEGFDMVCTMIANAAESSGFIPDGRNWKALVSTSEENAKDRVTLVGKIFNSDVKGAQILSPADVFWDTSIDWRAPHNFSATGTALVAGSVWTGSTLTGEYLFGNTCNDWISTNGAELGGVGWSGTPNYFRIVVSPVGCSELAGLYCLSD